MSGAYNDEMSDSYPFIDTVDSTVFVCAEIYFKDSAYRYVTAVRLYCTFDEVFAAAMLT